MVFWIWQSFSYLLEVEKKGKLQEMYSRLSEVCSKYLVQSGDPCTYAHFNT